MDVVLKRKITYEYLSNNKECINIGYGVDNNFMRGMMTSIVSFYINNSNSALNFHIITYNLSEDNNLKLKSIAQRYKINIYIYIIDIDIFKNLPVYMHLPISMYFRFALPAVLVNVNKLFYIDSDIICLKDASELFNIDMENNIIAAVPSRKKGNSINKNLGVSYEHMYFNSGVLVIDIVKWNNFDFLRKAIELLTDKSRNFSLPDQDVLNIIFTKKVKYLNIVYNCFVDYRNCINKVKNEEIVLLHYSSLPKPWNIAWSISKAANDFNRNLYAYYENKTPWKDIPLYEPKTYTDIGAYVKALYNNKEYFKAIIWLIKYFIIKNKN